MDLIRQRKFDQKKFDQEKFDQKKFGQQSSGQTQIRWEMPVLGLATIGLHAATAALLGAGVVLWAPERSPRWLLAAVALMCVVCIGYIVMRGDRFKRVEAVVMAAHLLVWVGLLTWTTGSSLGALSNGSILPLIGLYLVWFLPSLMGRIVAYAGGSWWMVAVAQRDDPVLIGVGVAVLVELLVVTELFGRVKRRMDRLVNTDMLTGTRTRRSITASINRRLREVRRGGPAFSVLAIDLDGLRDANTRGGHQEGDALLVQAVEFWRSRLGRCDRLGRVGGDEFVIVLNGHDSPQARIFAEELHGEAPVAFSVGVATARPRDTFDALLGRADRRMYTHKRRNETARDNEPVPPVQLHAVDPLNGVAPGVAGRVDHGEVIAADGS